MKVLAIGGTRFIGAHVVRQLHDAGARVTVFHRGSTGNPILPHVEHVRSASARYPITEFPDAVRRDWDVVVHMVAMGRADAEAVVSTFSGRAGRLVIISSCDVYRAYGRLTGMESGMPEPVPLGEEAPLRSVLYPYRGMEEQIGAYARDYDKILVERTVRNAQYLDWTILRLPKVYGAEDNSDLATVYGFASVPDWRWTHGHVSNVAHAIALAATHPQGRNAILNVGEQSTLTMGERLRRLPVQNAPTPDPPPFDYRQSLVMDTTRIRRDLGYVDMVEENAAMDELVRLPRR